MCCSKCSKMSGALLFLFGVAFLLVDLGVWTFWGLQWHSVAFLFAGLVLFASSCCPSCKASCCCGDSCCDGGVCEEPAPKAKGKKK